MSEPTLTGYLLTILPRFPACLSMLGSAMIISSVARSEKNRRNVQQRIIGAMSCFDFMVSSVWFLTFLFIPADKFEIKGFPLALGNDASCNAQGFVIQLSTASFIYNASLSFYYVFMIKYKWPKPKLASAEKYFHVFPISWALLTAIASVSMGLIGDADWDCWIKGEYNEYQWLFFFGPLFISLAITTFNMLQVQFYVQDTERKAAKWRQGRSNAYKNTIQVSKQNRLYFLSFVITWLLPSIARSIQLAGTAQIPPWFVVACGTVIPFQGFFNAIVYFRLRFNKCSEDHPDEGWWWLVYRIMLLTLLPCFLDDDHYNIHDGRDVERLTTSTGIKSSNIQLTPSEVKCEDSGWDMISGKDFTSSAIKQDGSIIVSNTSASGENVEKSKSPMTVSFQVEDCSNLARDREDVEVSFNGDTDLSPWLEKETKGEETQSSHP